MIQVLRTYAVATLVIFGLFVCGTAAEAATLYFSPSSGSYTVGQTVSVSLMVGSTDEPMNAVGATINVDTSIFDITSVGVSGSIIDFWAQNPAASGGVVSLEGVALAGYQGNAGRVATMQLRAKAAGSGGITLGKAEVLAHDGAGTPLSVSRGRGSYTVTIPAPAPTPAPVAETPAAPTEPKDEPEVVEEPESAEEGPAIFSPTHVDEDEWYANNNPLFTWSLPDEVTAVAVTQSTDGEPVWNFSTDIINLESQVRLQNIADGTHYFHLRYRTQESWGPSGTYQFNVDTKPPEDIAVFESVEYSLWGSRPAFTLAAEDRRGIAHFNLYLEDQLVAEWVPGDEPLALTGVWPGKRVLIVEAVDVAGNTTTIEHEFYVLGWFAISAWWLIPLLFILLLIDSTLGYLYVRRWHALTKRWLPFGKQKAPKAPTDIKKPTVPTKPKTTIKRTPNVAKARKKRRAFAKK